VSTLQLFSWFSTYYIIYIVNLAARDLQFFCLTTGGVCFTWRMMERIREMSFVCLLALGLKSQSFAILSHSVPGSIGSVSATNSFSALLHRKQNKIILVKWWSIALKRYIYDTQAVDVDTISTCLVINAAASELTTIYYFWYFMHLQSQLRVADSSSNEYKFRIPSA